MKIKNDYSLFSILIVFLTFCIVGNVCAANQTISNSTTGGLKTAIDNVGNGQTISMENGIYKGVNNRNLTISKNITIQGKGNNVVIDAEKQDRILTIAPNTRVNLINIKFTNGNISSAGGAIYNSGDLSVTGSTFTNNGAFDGGAIHSNGALSILSSVFTGNIASGDGGAVNSINKLSVSTSTFNDNKASRYGGAINSTGSTSVGTSKFNNNNASHHGGAICSEGLLLVSSSNFINNNASHHGGAIYNNNTLSVINSNFTNNNVGWYGGAIYGNTITVNNSRFINNKAEWYGGAIYVSSKGVLKIKSLTFQNNIAKSKPNNYYLETGVKAYDLTPAPKPVVVKKPDLQIAKITKKGNYRYVYVKNIGKAKAKANKLGIYIGKKWIKTVKVKAIKAGKSIRIKVFIPKKYRAKVKTFKVDIKNKVKESREKNNARKSR